MKVACVNRYGMSFVENKSPSHYETSGLLFSAYYRVACTRCGFTFAGPKWKRHNLKECDVIRAEIVRFKKQSGIDLKRRNLRGA